MQVVPGGMIGPDTRKKSKKPKKEKPHRPVIRNVMAALIDAGYSPADALVRVAKKSETESQDESYDIRVRQQFLMMAQRAAAELLEYTEPKLSRTELTGKDGEAIENKWTVEFLNATPPS
jgi:hypothetical protein